MRLRLTFGRVNVSKAPLGSSPPLGRFAFGLYMATAPLGRASIQAARHLEAEVAEHVGKGRK